MYMVDMFILEEPPLENKVIKKFKLGKIYYSNENR